MSDFVSDIKRIREHARKHMDNGAMTEGYKADRKRVIGVLNQVLATKIVCVLRYKRHYFMNPTSIPRVSRIAAIPNIPKAGICSP
jgi:hypothetical protein